MFFLPFLHVCQFSSVTQSCPTLATPWIAAHQASLSITNSLSSLKLMSIESVMPSSHLILCRPLLLPSVLPSIRVFSSESALHIRWPKYWNFSFSISPSNQYSELFYFQIDWFDLLAVATLRNVIKLNKLLSRIFNRTQKRGNHEGKSPCELDCSKI